MFKAGDQVRYRSGVNAAFPAVDRPDRRGLVGRVVAVQDAGMGAAGMSLVIEWPDGVDRTGCPMAWFEAVP